jgi:hypothetical protein
MADVRCAADVCGSSGRRSIRFRLVSSALVVVEDGMDGGLVANKGLGAWTSGLTRMLRRRPRSSSALIVLPGKRFDDVRVAINGDGVNTMVNNGWES